MVGSMRTFVTDRQTDRLTDWRWWFHKDSRRVLKTGGAWGGLIYNSIRIVSLSYLGISEPFSHQHIFIWININRMKRQTDRQKTCIIEDIKMTSRRSRNVLEGLTSSLVKKWAPKGHPPYQIGLNWPKNFTPSLIVITKNGEFRIKLDSMRREVSSGHLKMC